MHSDDKLFVTDHMMLCLIIIIVVIVELTFSSATQQPGNTRYTDIHDVIYLFIWWWWEQAAAAAGQFISTVNNNTMRGFYTKQWWMAGLRKTSHRLMEFTDIRREKKISEYWNIVDCFPLMINIILINF